MAAGLGMGAMARPQLGPGEGPVQTVSLRNIARKNLVDELAWAYEEAGAQAQRTMDRVTVKLGEVAGVVSYGLRTATGEIRPPRQPEI